MKSLILGLVMILSCVSAQAAGLTSAELVGEYSLSGNGGFLVYDLSFNDDGTSSLSQVTLGGAEIKCHGRFNLDEVSQDLVTVYNCDGMILTQKASLAGIADADLDAGTFLLVNIRASNGTDANLAMFLKRK